MDEQRQDDQLETLINNSALKTYRERWTKETSVRRGSERSMLAAQHDDDDYTVNSSVPVDLLNLILVWFGLVWFGFMAYINRFIHIY